MRKLLLLTILIFFINNCKTKTEIWYCPMHPTYNSEHSGQCPICNMDLIKKVDISETIHSTENHQSSPKVESENTIVISKANQELIGIKTTLVRIIPLQKRIIAYSRVAYDPELYTAIVEYKEAKKNYSSDPIYLNILNASVLRLKQLGLTESEINKWSSSQKNPDELIIGSSNGKAYIYSSIFESDISFVKKGQDVQLKIDSFPDKTFIGNIYSIDSILDNQNRTLRFRSYVSDKENLLKPQMFGNLEITIPLKKALSIPKTSLINTGKHKIVYKKISEDKFTIEMIKTGIETDEYYEVIEGLKENDEIVLESNFLLDSESKIKLGGKINEHNH